MTQSNPAGAGAALSPEYLHQITFSFAPSRVLTAAVQLKVFSHLAAGKQTARAIASAARASERGMRMLLDALVPLQLVSKKNGAYGLPPFSAQYLVPSSPDYAGSFLEIGGLWDSWSDLTRVVRSGKPAFRVEREKLAESFFPVLVRSLHIINRDPARRTAELLLAKKSGQELRVVDVACGSGVWGIAIAQAAPRARVTAQDFSGMLPVTRRYLRQHGVARQFDFLPGDLKRVDFGKAQYDVALLGNIVHSEGERSSRDLFRRLHRALRPGGRIVIVDMIPNEDRSGPAFPVFFALNMLLNTTAGDTYTMAQYREWLKKAGFSRVESADIGSHSPLVIGYKKLKR